MDEKQEFLQKTTEEILLRLGVAAKASLFLGEDKRYFLEIDGHDLGALIGYHGEALSSLQLVLSLAAYRRFNEWIPLTADAGGYRLEREEKLKSLTQRTVDKVRFLSREIPLPPLPALERRIVHTQAAEFPDIVSESRGEGRERHVVLRLRQEGEERVKL